MEVWVHKQHLDIPLGTLSRYPPMKKKRLGRPLGKRPHTKEGRHALRLLKRGWSTRRVAAAVGLSHQRVWQLKDRWL